LPERLKPVKSHASESLNKYRYIESHQPQLGEEIKGYIKNFRAGGEPIMDNEGHITGFKGGISLRNGEWTSPTSHPGD
jgi:hypothetical protein